MDVNIFILNPSAVSSNSLTCSRLSLSGDRKAGRQAGRQAGRKAGSQAGRQAERQAARQAGRQVGSVSHSSLILLISHPHFLAIVPTDREPVTG